MKLFRSISISLASLFLFASIVTAPALEPDPGQIAISVGRLMEQGHYSRQKLDNKLSAAVLKTYLETLDYSRLFFTQRDIADFESKYNETLDDDVLLGNSEPAIQIYEVYKKRVEDRITKVKQWIATEKFDFKSSRSVQLNRQKAAWPADEAEADQLWRDRLESEFLQEKLSEHAIDPPVKVLTRRYDGILHTLHEQTNRDAVNIFLTSVAQTYDPHSEYMSKEELENFNITMRLSLVGIGAVLQRDDGYAKIMELVTGGPAQKEGHLKVGDRVCAVAQGTADFVDTIDMKLDKVVAKIRGKKGTKVRLQVVPAHATDPSTRKIIEITRDKVELKDQRAKAEIIEKPNGRGTPQRLGWITLPSFYADMSNSSAADARSTTKDVRILLERLKKENISGLVIDLRKNGGGSLEEVIKLTGLFIKKHNPAVVQVKDANGIIKPLCDDETSDIYDGPLIILTNTLSASASEIFAGALQDYGRAVIVGDHHTFGKGTVQTMLLISKFIPFMGGNENDAGALKLTIQKFYRVAGGSTQFKGVLSDIVLPSLFDQPDIGEAALRGPLPYDEVPAADVDKQSAQPLFLDELRTRSAARVASNPEFNYVTQDLERINKKVSENQITLNEQARRDEIAKEKAIKEKRIAERARRRTPEPKVYSITFDNIDKPELEVAKVEPAKPAAAESPKPGKKGAKAGDSKKETKAEQANRTSRAPNEDEDDPENLDTDKGPKVDPIRNEGICILSDLIELSKGTQDTPTEAKTASRGTK